MHFTITQYIKAIYRFLQPTNNTKLHLLQTKPYGDLYSNIFQIFKR